MPEMEVTNEAEVTVREPKLATALGVADTLEATGPGHDTLPLASLDALLADSGLTPQPTKEAALVTPSSDRGANQQPVFGELEVGSDTVTKRKQGPVTLDDLEELLADSIPTPLPRR
jgi:hypothetical protein